MIVKGVTCYISLYLIKVVRGLYPTQYNLTQHLLFPLFLPSYYSSPFLTFHFFLLLLLYFNLVSGVSNFLVLLATTKLYIDPYRSIYVSPSNRLVCLSLHGNKIEVCRSFGADPMGPSVEQVQPAPFVYRDLLIRDLPTYDYTEASICMHLKCP